MNEGMFSGVRRNFSDAQQQQEDDKSMFGTGEINAAQFGLRTLGNTVEGTLGNVVGEATSALLPDGVEDAMGKGINWAMNVPLDLGQLSQPTPSAAQLAERYPEQARDLGAALSVAEVVPFVRGASLAYTAGKNVDQMTGAESNRGALVSSANNVIGGFYDPLRKVAGIAAWLPTQVKNTVTDLLDPRSRALYRTEGITGTTQKIAKKAMEGAQEGRGLLRNSMAKVPFLDDLAKKFEFPEFSGTKRAIAQLQYQSRIHAQSGRKGGTNLLDEILERSDLVEATAWQPGAYSAAVMVNDLLPNKLDRDKRRKDGKRRTTLDVNEGDLAYIEEHFSTVWKEPSAIPFKGEIPFSKTENPILVIKRPGVGGGETGGHYTDVLQRASYAGVVKKMFKEVDSVDPAVLLQTLTDAETKLKDTKREFTVVRDRVEPDGSVWITGSMNGSGITEGGINYLTKVTPNGKMIGVMSDEHNLFESMAAKIQKRVPIIPSLSAMRHLLPNRLIAVTPPMVLDFPARRKNEQRAIKEGNWSTPRELTKAEIAVGKKQKEPQLKVDPTYEHPSQRAGTPQSDTTNASLLDNIIKAEPDADVLKAEVQRNKGMLLGSGGSLLMTNEQEEEEGGR